MKETVSLKLDPNEKERLIALAASKGRSVHFLMREAIARYVTAEEAREAFRREAAAGWKEYQETGLHLSLDEVEAWMDTWGTKDEGPAPPCHV